MKIQRKSLVFGMLTGLALLFVQPVGSQLASSTKVANSRTSAQLESADQALSNNDARGAFRLASAVLLVDPKNARAFFIRGKARAQYDDSKNALIDLCTGMRLAPRLADSAVYVLMAQAYLQMKEPERALHTLEEGNRQKPDLELYQLSASINNLHGHDKEALSDIEKALKFDPSSRTMLLLRGSIYDRNHDYEHAIKEYSLVIEISIKGKLQDSNRMEAVKKRSIDYDKTGKKELAHRSRNTEQRGLFLGKRAVRNCQVMTPHRGANAKSRIQNIQLLPSNFVSSST